MTLGPEIKLFKFGNTTVQLSFLSLLLIFIYLIPVIALYFSPPAKPLAWWLLPFLLVVLLAMLVGRESVRWLWARLLGNPTLEIKLELWGGHNSYSVEPTTIKAILIALVGPLFHLAIYFVADTALLPTLNTVTTSNSDLTQLLFLSSLRSLNLFLAVYGFLPCYPLDGGQAFYQTARRLTGQHWFAAGLTLLAGLLVVLDMFTDFSRLNGRIYVAGLFPALLAISIVVSSVNLLIQPKHAEQKFTRPQPNPAAAEQAAAEVAQLLAANNKETAILALTRAYSLDATCPAYLFQRAQLFTEKQNYFQALVDYSELIELGKLTPVQKNQCYRARANLYRLLEMPELAAQDEKVANNGPKAQG